MENEKPEETSLLRAFGRGLGQEVATEARTWLLWAVCGAVVGAVLLGGAGLYLFGLQGLGIGLIAGIILGGIVSWLFYLFASAGI